MNAVVDLAVERDVPIPTWFGIGGRAEQFARPHSLEQLQQCVAADPKLRLLGDGANLLVDDDGVGDLVVSLSAPAFTGWRADDRTGYISVGAGANLPKLIVDMVRAGRAGLEGLGGIPATIGGAVMMNAGGAFGQIADAVVRVHAIDRRPGGGGVAGGGALASTSRATISTSVIAPQAWMGSSSPASTLTFRTKSRPCCARGSRK